MYPRKGREEGKDANPSSGRESGKDRKSVRMDRMVRKDEKRMEKENDCFGGEGRNRRFSPSRLAFSSAFPFPFSFLLFFFFVKKQQKRQYMPSSHPRKHH